MNKAMYVYLLATTRSGLFGLLAWTLYSVLKEWPLTAALPMALAFTVVAAVAFSPYLLFRVVHRFRRFLYFVPAVGICLVRGFYGYQLAAGRVAELSFSDSSSPLHIGHVWIAECLIVLGVCISIYRRHKTFYDRDPVDELFKV